MGRPQSADNKFVRARGPQIGTQKCSTKRGLREPLNVEIPLNDRELVKTEVFEKINSVHTRCIAKASGFTRGVCKKKQGF